jgi:threonine/homoserine/homoserine lactone efflux protein
MGSQFTLFLIASIALVITPGQDTLYVVTRGMGQGKVAGVISAIGVSSGVIIHTLFAVLGLSVILQSSAFAFTAIKIAGAVYLVYLGIKTLLNTEAFVLEPSRQRLSRQMLFWQGFLSNVFNPKVALFFLAFLPQFVAPHLGHPVFQMIMFGFVIMLLGVVWLSCVGYFAGSMRSWIKKSAIALSILRWMTGSILIGLGMRLAIAERR